MSKAPRWVQRTATQTLRYLNATKTEGILLDKDMGEDTDGRKSRGAGLEVITDASFAPGGEISHGCVMVKWQGSMLAWRSSRQSFPTLSTAESELMEMIEGMVLGDSVDALIQEIKTEMDYSRTLVGDNQAAVALCTGDAGSWRTRHLRLRAFYVRLASESVLSESVLSSVCRELAYVICARWQVWWRLEHQSQKKEEP